MVFADRVFDPSPCSEEIVSVDFCALILVLQQKIPDVGTRKINVRQKLLQHTSTLQVIAPDPIVLYFYATDH